MKKLGRLTLKELGSNVPIIPQSILEQIKGGDVTVTFDRSSGMIYIFGDGVLISCAPAANNVVSGRSSWPNGTYSMENQWAPVGCDSYSGAYGQLGGWAANDFYDPNICRDRTGMMLHAGRRNDYTSNTYGCIRTTSDGIAQVEDAIASYGPFTSITVRP